jgi:CheY-like chemotaxis protein
MKKVVVAESSPTIKSVADSLLRQSGFDVVCTSDGLQAWEVICAEKPDLVLAGLTLSGISGLELCRQITSDRATGGIPVVLMIGANDTLREEELLASGARARLKKPFSPKDLLDISGRLTGAAKSSDSDESQYGSKSVDTKFVTQVSSTQHLHKKQETYNLDWLDLKNATPSKHISRVASFDLANEDQSLIIDDDQYGLASQLAEEDEKAQPASAVDESKDSDYDWFIGEMKREMENKNSDKLTIETLPLPESSGPGAPRVSPDIEFGDIRPAAGPASQPARPRDAKFPQPSPDRGRDISGLGEQPAFPKSASGAPPIKPRFSDDEIVRIADQVASRLAAHLASQIDKSLIIDAIKAELKL